MSEPIWSDPEAVPTDEQVDEAAAPPPREGVFGNAPEPGSHRAEVAELNPNSYLPPEGEGSELAGQPWREYLRALVADVVGGRATLNWQPSNNYVRGEVAAVTRCIARALQHVYGAKYQEAFFLVENAVKKAVGTRGLSDPDWDVARVPLADEVLRDILK